MLTIRNPKVEYLTNPVCIPLDRVRFSWMVDSDMPNQRQLAYQIVVRKESNSETVWDSGKTLSDDMTGILYNGPQLLPRTTYIWQVRVWSDAGECSDYCTPQSFTTCLSSKEWESADWIGANVEGLPLLRKNFMIMDKKVTGAYVYACGLGTYELTLNGEPVSEDVLNPIVTRYHKRYFYNAYDITPLLRDGENVFGIMLGNGYYCMNDNGVDWQKTKWANAPWADRPKCKLVAFITYADGSETHISTDETWKYAESPLRVDEPYYGEEYDARKEQNGWNNIDFDDKAWDNAMRVPGPIGQASIQLADSCKIIETLPLKPLYKEANEYLFDTQKMIAGWTRIRVCGNPGDEVEVSYSEWLDEHNKLDQKGLLDNWDFADRIRQPQTDYFVLKGSDEETFAPHFTYKGFRYVRIRTKGSVTLNHAVAEVVHADLPETGHFACSDDYINQLHAACKNTLLNNLHSYPSDTPVYENLAYLADGYLSQEMAHFNFDATKFYEKWSHDILDQAKENGYIEQTAPMWDEDKENAPEWSVSIAIVPYQVYRATGDKTTLLENYEKAKKVFAYQMSLTDNGIATSMWGDHAGASNHMIKEISSTAYLFYTANILAKTAKMQENKKEHLDYSKQANAIKCAFNKRFYNEEKGYYCEYGNTDFLINAQVLSYALGLADDQQKASIKECIKKYGTSLDGGIFSIKYLFPVLTEMGLEERLYEWVTSKEAPSWGYWLSFGDNSLWEQWYDHTRSRNHHMFGTVDEWLYKSLAGLEPIDHKTLHIKPYFAHQLQWASADTMMPGGKASCRWEKCDNEIRVEVEIPFNTTATICIPTVSDEIIEVGSGKYHFTVPY